jgi:cupin 2 domain-containing protein
VTPHNIFKDIPSNCSEEIFELLESNEHVRIERIISQGQKSPATGWYDQGTAEWVLLLKGNASIEFEDGSVADLDEGD